MGSKSKDVSSCESIEKEKFEGGRHANDFVGCYTRQHENRSSFSQIQSHNLYEYINCDLHYIMHDVNVFSDNLMYDKFMTQKKTSKKERL